MAIVKGKGQQTTAVQGESEGADVFLRALRDGSMVIADWKQAAVMGGYGFMCNLGTFSTFYAGGGATSILDIDRPQLVVSIPNGTAFIPLRIGVHVQSGAPADAQEVEILIAVDQDKAIPTDGGGTAVTVYNMNTLVARATTVTVRRTFSTDISSAPILDLELARKVIEFDVVTSGIVPMEVDLVYEPASPPIINGPAAVIIYYGGDAVVEGGFAEVSWLELSESAFSV